MGARRFLRPLIFSRGTKDLQILGRLAPRDDCARVGLGAVILRCELLRASKDALPAGGRRPSRRARARTSG
jgi:hypothetical protein